MSNFTFFKQWAQYRKTGQIQNPLVLINHRPSNVQELSFLLQITTSLSLLNFLPLQSLQSPFQSTLLTINVNNNLISDKINQNYILNLLQLYKHLTSDIKIQSHLHNIREVLVQTLKKLFKINQQNVKNQKLNHFILLGVCFDKIHKTKPLNEGLEIIRTWWTSKKQYSDYLTPQSFYLLILWGYFQQKNQMQWLQDSTRVLQKCLDIWVQSLEATLSQQKQITQGTILSIEKETKQFCSLWYVKNSKTLHNQLKLINHSMLKKYASRQQPLILATLFTSFQIFAQEIETIIYRLDDLMDYQYVFYKTLLDLQQRDRLYLFPRFHSFMRQHSVMAVLQVNFTLTAQLQSPKYKRSIQVQKALSNKDLSIIKQFLTKPIKTSQLVLDYYLQLSGVKIKQPKQRIHNRSNRFQKMKVTDPLLFILIPKDHWNDKFGYQTLGISLWIMTEAYCKQLSQRKKNPEKEVQQYIKKSKVTLCIFLLSLKYPAKMLQYLPEQSDIVNQFIYIPILPSLLVQTGYFFDQFQRDTLTFRSKIQINSEVDVFPWKYKLFILNNIPSILHNYKGYQFYNIGLNYVSSITKKEYCETILKSISSALQGLGLHQMGSEQDRQQCLTFHVKEQKIKEIQSLLLRLSKLGDKVGNTATHLLKLCSVSQ